MAWAATRRTLPGATGAARLPLGMKKLVGALAVAVVLPATAVRADVPAIPVSSELPARVPWWLAFDDSTLNLLQLLARGAAEGEDADAQLLLEARVAAAYVEARTQTLLAMNARQARDTLERWTADAAARQGLQAAAAQQLDTALAGRTRALDALTSALHGERGRAALEVMLSEALAQARMPLPRGPVADDVPASWLQLRPDVRRYVAQGTTAGTDDDRLVGYLRSLSGSIAPATWQDRLVARVALRRDPLATARLDVAKRLAEVRAAAGDVAAAEAALHEATRQWQAAAAQAGAARQPPPPLMEATLQSLAAERRLIEDSGRLSQAWIALEFSVGGAG